MKYKVIFVVLVQVQPSAIICRPSATWSAFVGVATEGSIPKGGCHALVAQLVEYRTFNPEAVGPSPTGRTKTKTEGCPATDNPLFHFAVMRDADIFRGPPARWRSKERERLQLHRSAMRECSKSF